MLSQSYDGITILRPFREVTQIEVDFYCSALNIAHQKEESKSERINSVQSLSSLFMTNLALVGQKSNPSAIIRMAEKIKSKSWWTNIRVENILLRSFSDILISKTNFSETYKVDF